MLAHGLVLLDLLFVAALNQSSEAASSRVASSIAARLLQPVLRMHLASILERRSLQEGCRDLALRGFRGLKGAKARILHGFESLEGAKARLLRGFESL